MKRATITGTAATVRAVDPGFLLTGAAVVFASLSMMSGWWLLPTVVTAFLAGRRPGRTGPTVLALVAVLSAGVVAFSVVPGWLPLASRFLILFVAATMSPWFAGRFWRQYQDLVRAGWERAEQAQREQRLVAEQARLRERARIAQDMHDLLGHDLSLIALSAGALKLAPGLEEHHRKAAADLRARAGAAVDRLGEVIGVLREQTDSAPMDVDGPDLAALTAAASASGLVVKLHIDGEAGDLPPMAERAMHRVAQEALTNVAKHAPGAMATISVTHTATETTIVVENGPPPSPAGVHVQPGGGRGLVGLAERMRLVGGTFEYGPHHGGFAVTARIPRTPVPPPVTPWNDRTLPQEHRRARRRVGRSLVLAVMVPLVTGGLLSGALAGWETLSASQAVLDPGDYARLRIGQDRSEVERVLPRRQTRYRPSAAEPTEDGVTCEYYAMTADRFDDRSGDAYRLCFRDNVLVSRDTVTP
ncbi:sensor histidine kinase [Micromonospora sp. KC207]|uniref:sensor histidine kinase n=1 Tax=Micromonospora sp. KC207 TaxID=2530377 RepID=UPI001046C75F|nr:histidine kinase [Micromonospora sp. KC207]TDC60560.1 sensor histidine kinase [Micromonospora sp. KC207]